MHQHEQAVRRSVDVPERLNEEPIRYLCNDRFCRRLRREGVLRVEESGPTKCEQDARLE